MSPTSKSSKKRPRQPSFTAIRISFSVPTRKKLNVLPTVNAPLTRHRTKGHGKLSTRGFVFRKLYTDSLRSPLRGPDLVRASAGRLHLHLRPRHRPKRHGPLAERFRQPGLGRGTAAQPRLRGGHHLLPVRGTRETGVRIS